MGKKYPDPCPALAGMLAGLVAQSGLTETLWTVASQAPSVEFFRQEYWSGLPFSSSRGSSQSWGSNLCLLSPALQADSLPAQPPAVHIPKLH